MFYIDVQKNTAAVIKEELVGVYGVVYNPLSYHYPKQL